MRLGMVVTCSLSSPTNVRTFSKDKYSCEDFLYSTPSEIREWQIIFLTCNEWDSSTKKFYLLLVCTLYTKIFISWLNPSPSSVLLPLPLVDLVVEVVVVVHVGPWVLVVGVPAADVNGVAGHYVDTGLKLVMTSSSCPDDCELWHYYERDPQHLHSWRVVEDLVDHHTLQVTVDPGHALHCTRTPGGNLLHRADHVSHLVKSAMCLGILSKLDYKYIFLFFAVWSCLSSPDKRFTLSRGGRSSSRSTTLLEIVSRLTRLLLLLRLLRPGIFLDRRSSIRLLFSHWLGLHWPRLWSRLRKVFNIYMRNSKKLYFSIHQYYWLITWGWNCCWGWGRGWGRGWDWATVAGPGLGGGAGDRDPVIQFNFLIYKPEEKCTIFMCLCFQPDL